ncbi:MAG: hypothetical protein ABJC04_09705 [Verrucomicrobiota bacterium]
MSRQDVQTSLDNLKLTHPTVVTEKISDYAATIKNPFEHRAKYSGRFLRGFDRNHFFPPISA